MTVLDTDLAGIRNMEHYLDRRITTAVANEQYLREFVPSADVIIGAMVTADSRAPLLVTEDMIASMRPGSVVVDAVFANPWERAAIERTARSLDVTFAPVWLDAPEDVLVSRVSHRDSDASDADAKVVHMQCARWSGDVPWPRVDATGEREAVEGRARARLRAQFVAVDSAA